MYLGNQYIKNLLNVFLPLFPQTEHCLFLLGGPPFAPTMQDETFGVLRWVSSLWLVPCGFYGALMDLLEDVLKSKLYQQSILYIFFYPLKCYDTYRGLTRTKKWPWTSLSRAAQHTLATYHNTPALSMFKGRALHSFVLSVGQTGKTPGAPDEYIQTWISESLMRETIPPLFTSFIVL